MLEHLPNTAVRMFGSDLVYTLVGGGLLRELGLDPKAIEGTPVLLEFDESGRSRAHDACVSALDGCTTSFDVMTRERFLECTAVPVLEEGRVIGGVLISRDVSDRKRNESQLHAFARTDVLTGVANPLRLRLALRRALRTSDPLALLALDIDDFQSLNATRGHQEGDRYLRAVANAVEESTRPVDTVARVGGDEFVVILTGAGLDAAVLVARRIRSAIGALPYGLTVSIGMACFPHDATDSHGLRKKADAAMHAEKNAHALRMRGAQK